MTQPPQAQPPPGGAPKGAIASAIAQIFAYIDRPWKAVVVIVLILIGGAGWVIYQHQEQIIEAWLTPSELQLRDIHTISEALAELASETSADIAQVSTVDAASNTLCFLVARDAQGHRPVVPKPRCISLVGDSTDYPSLVLIMKGQSVCIDLTGKASPLVERLASRNMVRGCVIPIPASAQNWKGIIILGWITAVSKSSEDDAVRMARETAGKLINR